MKNTMLITCLGAAIVAGATLEASAAGGEGHRGGPRHSFEDLDINGDGKITPAELASHKQGRFEQADANGDGVLTRDEMLARASERAKDRAAKHVDRMLERHDANGDGVLSLDEMQARGGGKMFEKADADGDGAISKEEFEAMKAHRRGAHKPKSKDRAE